MVGALQGMVDGCREFGGGYVAPTPNIKSGSKKELPINFALIEEITDFTDVTRIAGILSGSLDVLNVGDSGIVLFAVDISAVSLDLEFEKHVLSLFSLGNASASLGLKGVPYAEAVISLWSPSVTLLRSKGKNITFTLHVGALGYGYSFGPTETSFTFAKGFGFSVSTS